MAENEYLDLHRSRRWQRVLRALRDGNSPGQIASLAGICLQRTVNALHKPLFEGGPPQVPLEELLDSTGDVGKAESILHRCHGHDFVRLFQDVAHAASSREEALKNWLSGIRDRYFDQIQHAAIDDGSHTVSKVHTSLDQVRGHMKEDIERMAKQLATDPKRTLRRPRSSTANETKISTESILGESLLGPEQ